MDVYYGNMGTVLCERGFVEEAIQYYLKALTHAEIQPNMPPARLVSAYCNLGVAYDRLFAYKISLKYYEKASELSLRFYGQNHPEYQLIQEHVDLLRRKTSAK
eukprot:TRINITY_DN3437_c0_g1_i2.p2 TRINITY_DN3437_c0_g1~~TRINITY_DN3437_c0_g1_i2.p2  ORF type:complete len:103 (-),score=16.50 TRINITY_DN3437_c0_g1_i2:134-442(-)